MIRRFDDDGVAARERRGGLPAQQAQRVVERQDDHDHAERLLGREMELVIHRGTQHLARLVAGNLGVIVGGCGRPHHLVRRFLVRLAHLARQHFGNHRACLAHRVRSLVQKFRSPVVVDFAPEFLRGIRGPDRGIDLRGHGFDELADDLLGRRIDDRYALPVLAAHLSTIDQMPAAQLPKETGDAHGNLRLPTATRGRFILPVGFVAAQREARIPLPRVVT